jgi:hypothetical protein
MPVKPPEAAKPEADCRRVLSVSSGYSERSTVVPARPPACGGRLGGGGGGGEGWTGRERELELGLGLELELAYEQRAHVGRLDPGLALRLEDVLHCLWCGGEGLGVSVLQLSAAQTSSLPCDVNFRGPSVRGLSRAPLQPYTRRPSARPRRVCGRQRSKAARRAWIGAGNGHE